MKTIRLALEKVECRLCLSTIGFVPRDIFVNEVKLLSSAQLVDIDGDQDLDVVATGGDVDSAIPSLSWFENLDGRGSFIGSQRAIGEFAGGVAGAAAADFDGDGDVDIAVSATSELGGPASLHLYENEDGRGTFRAKRWVARGGAGILATDVDADGDPDLVVRASWSGTSSGVYWLENLDGHGTFGPEIDISSTATREVHSADIDRDGYQDLVILDFDSIHWLRNLDGNGTFSSERLIASTTNTESIVAADLDGDQDLDVAAASGRLTWYANEDNGNSFGEATRVDVGLGRFSSLSYGDYEADGDVDLLVADDDGVRWYLNDGQGLLLNWGSVSSSEARQAVPGDIDGDGFLNALWRTNIWEDQLRWGEDHTVSQRSSSYNTDLIGTGDVDGDGDLDVVTLGDGDLEPALAWQESSDGEFGPRRAIGEWEEGGTNVYYRDAVVFDANGDSLPDVATIESKVGHDIVAWQMNTGSGTFGPAMQIEDNISVYELHSADLDADGDEDLLGLGGDKVVWFENLLGATFSKHRTIAESNNLRGIVIGDIDNDGISDLIANFNGERRVLRNLSDGTFEEVDASIELGVQLIADLDGDGRSDLFGWETGQGPSWQRGIDSPQRFAESTELLAVPLVEGTDQPIGFPLDSRFADVDSDGDNDLVMHFGLPLDPQHVYWFENLDGKGEFAAGRRIGGYEPIFDLQLADVNADGFVDIVTGPDPRWYENRLAGDVDGNGQVDFGDFLQLSANFGRIDAVWADGDFNADARVGFEDFLALSFNFGKRR